MSNDTITLVSTDWLADNLHSPDIRVLDGSWYLPTANRDCRTEFNSCHIPGARFFDIDEIADHDSDLPHMAPPPEVFVSHVRSMGIGNGHQVVVYDTSGLLSAARVWWLFRLMGHDHIAVLDGGLKKWCYENKPVDDLVSSLQDRHFYARRQSHLVCGLAEIQLASSKGSTAIIDARSRGRFDGIDPEPRPGLQSGHIPNSINIPFEMVLQEDDTLRPKSELVEIFTQQGLNLNEPVITTCGSGVTAAILSLALEHVGHRYHSLYDGSWAEWGLTIKGNQTDN